jgi:hypothetical protein
MEDEEYPFDDYENVKNFTWDELINYNLSYVKGIRKYTFYCCGPYDEEEDVENIAELIKTGIFVMDGQTGGTSEYVQPNGEKRRYNDKAFLHAYVPLEQAKKIVEKAKHDPEVVLDMSMISTKEPLYSSPEIETALEKDGYLSLTRYKFIDRYPNMVNLSKKNPFVYTHCTYSKRQGGFYEMKDVGFTHLNTWIQAGLCYMFIAEKEFCKNEKSLAGRIVEYLKE